LVSEPDDSKNGEAAVTAASDDHPHPSPARAALRSALNLALFGLALWALDRVLRAYPATELLRALRAVPARAVLLAVVVTLLGYLALVAYDVVAFRYVGPRLPLVLMLVPSFISFAVSNNAPASMVTAGGVRYRLYRPYGLTPLGAAAVAGLNIVTYALGLCVLSGIALLFRPQSGPGAGLPGRVLGVLLLAGVLAYLVATRFVRGAVRVRGREVRLPPLPIAIAQLGVSVADWMLSSGALYVLLAAATPVPYLAFLTAFLVSQFASLLVPIPGGLGVFEAGVLILRPNGVAAPVVLAALLVYRVVYYLLPLVAAGTLLTIRALDRIRRSDQPIRTLVGRVHALAPRLLALTAFLSGVVLLASGAIPADDRRLAWLAKLLPLSVIEASHFLSSIVGAVLILTAWGLERRSHFAYQLVRFLFGAGILLTLLRSFDLHLAGFLAIVLAVTILAGREFPRPAGLAREPMGPRWVFAAGAVFLVEAWIGALLYRHVEFAGEVWWRFALFGQGSRALRAAAGASVVILLFAIERLISGTIPTVRR
jgi:phosphatidylglycerol lysyltransferase